MIFFNSIFLFWWEESLYLFNILLAIIFNSSDIPLELNVRRVDENTSTTSNITLSNDAIEAKLKALLESTETESTS